MEYIEIINSLKMALTVKYAEKKNFEKQIARVLGINIRRVANKLSGKSHFTIEEISKLCEELEIPINEILYRSSSPTRHPMELMVHDFKVEKESHTILRWTVEAFVLAAKSDYSKFYVICNTLPDVLYPVFNWIARFSGLKWLYFNRGCDSVTPLSQLIQSEESRELHKKYIKAVYAMKQSVYIVNSNLMENYITELRNFYLLRYIQKDEVMQLLEELVVFLNYLEIVCTNGCLENGKEIEFYCIDMFLPNDIYMVESDLINFGIIYANQINPIVTKTPETLRNMKMWFNAWRRSSSMISLSGTYLRKQFFLQQYKTLENFKTEINL